MSVISFETKQATFSITKKLKRDVGMIVRDILNKKGSQLHTIKSTETIGKAARHLQQRRVGVMIVSDDGRTIDGIISERDIAYSLADRRGELHLLPVSVLMTTSHYLHAGRHARRHRAHHEPASHPASSGQIVVAACRNYQHPGRAGTAAR